VSGHVPVGPVEAPPVLLVYGSGGRVYREYLLKELSSVYRLWLFSDDEPSWQQPYLLGYSVVDTLSAPTAAEAAVKLAAELPVRGVFCYDEVRLVQAAAVATALGLPGSPVAALEACRDKHRSRQLMADAGVPQAVSCCVRDLAQASAAAEQIGYPVIVKPRALAGSEGVMLVEHPEQLPAAVQAASRAHFREVPRYEAGLLVEEYLDGAEISVDSVVVDGEVQPLFIAHKQLDYADTFEETGHLLKTADPLLDDEDVRQVLGHAHQAIGFDRGVTHTELRLTSSGPRIVELNGRLGGDLIPFLGWLATGIEAGLVAGALAAGHTPELAPRRHGAAGIRFLYPPSDLRLAQIDVDMGLLPAGVWEVRPLAAVGQVLRLPPRAHVAGRAAAVIATGATAQDCLNALGEAERAVRITGDPVEAVP
jgi:biotin carboxylase